MSPNLKDIALKFVLLARARKGAYREIIRAAESIAKSTSCDYLFTDDEDGMVPYDPSIEAMEVYDLKGEDWTPILRRADRDFDRLCESYLELAKSMGVKNAEDSLEAAISDNFWQEIGLIEGEELSGTYDEVREKCMDKMNRNRDPYGYRGVNRRDFMASSHTSPENAEAVNKVIRSGKW